MSVLISDSSLLPADDQFPVLPVTNVLVSAENLRKVGSIYWVETGFPITFTAEVALPNSEMMVMIEKVVRGTTPVADIRRPVTIRNGQLSLQFTPTESGNYILSAARLNEGLRKIGKEFRLQFNDVEFDAYASL